MQLGGEGGVDTSESAANTSMRLRRLGTRGGMPSDRRRMLPRGGGTVPRLIGDKLLVLRTLAAPLLPTLVSAAMRSLQCAHQTIDDTRLIGRPFPFLCYVCTPKEGLFLHDFLISQGGLKGRPSVWVA